MVSASKPLAQLGVLWPASVCFGQQYSRMCFRGFTADMKVEFNFGNCFAIYEFNRPLAPTYNFVWSIGYGGIYTFQSELGHKDRSRMC